jgi:hypothetical protein
MFDDDVRMTAERRDQHGWIVITTDMNTDETSCVYVADDALMGELMHMCCDDGYESQAVRELFRKMGASPITPFR